MPITFFSHLVTSADMPSIRTMSCLKFLHIIPILFLFLRIHGISLLNFEKKGDKTPANTDSISSWLLPFFQRHPVFPLLERASRHEDNPRIFNIPPRDSKQWGKEYDRRTSVERSNKREKQDYKLDDGKHRSTKMWYCRLYGIMMCQHLDA